ncbi:ABC transporter ATP-binding protein [Halovivax cerinus]|uniref:Probable branched-chain amino acid transport ATP-binding protein LivG n=1 Tax=Halovivax cerinus TaxID=1487865 RepID=A0ABD5NPQ1_9EURY|nr:ABC transporter ATP-binding protein [Halovivax cerinus]
MTERSSSGEAVTDPKLSVTGLEKTFDGITAVDGVSFDVQAGEMTGLIGPNGAGKSTTFNCITNLIEPDAGSVVFDGQDVTGLPTHRVARTGLVRTFQIARELREMTVLENMMVSSKEQTESAIHAVTPGLRENVRTEEEAILEQAWETLEFFDIEHVAHEYAGTLSGGQRKLLELARALMADPDMLLLDEPFAGVNPTLEERLLDRLHALTDQGYTFLIVEHDIDLIMNNCVRVLVMHQGQLLAEGAPETVRDDERVIDAYLGGEAAQ